MEGCTPGPAATVWAHCVVEAKQIAYLHWINTGTKKALTGAKGPAACLSAQVTLILIVTIIPRGAASIDNWQGNALRMELKPLCSLHTHRSNEKHTIMHGGGGGGGKCQCDDCGFQLKTSSARQKCTRRITESPPYNCTHCNVSVQAKGKNKKLWWKILLLFFCKL